MKRSFSDGFIKTTPQNRASYQRFALEEFQITWINSIYHKPKNMPQP